MFRKIISVEPLENYILRIVFKDGNTELFDIKPIIEKNEHFRPLVAVPGLFKQVKVDTGGYGISWNDSIDLEF
jgi:hypothetical protein